MKRQGPVLSLVAASGMMVAFVAFGASLAAHAGAVNPAAQPASTVTAAPSVVNEGINIEISTGQIQNTYSSWYTSHGGPNSSDNEEFTALSNEIPAALAEDLLGSTLVQGNPQLASELTSIAGQADNPTVGEFLTQEFPTEVAFATSPQNQVNFGPTSVVVAPSSFVTQGTNSNPFTLQSNDIYANGNFTASQAVEDIAETTVGDRTVDSSLQGSQNTLGNEQFVLSSESTSSSTSQVTAGGITFNQTTVQQTITVGGININLFQLNGSRVISPIVLDVAGTGKLEASNGQWLPHPQSFDKSSARLFDFFNNGFPVAMEWVGAHDGLLVEPKADGSVDGSCLFGTQGGWMSGYQKLAQRDVNHDGRLTGDELNGLAVWVDANRDGVCQPGELKSLASLGITEISVLHHNFKSTFVMNGQTRSMWDWCPSALEVRHVSLDTARRELQADKEAMQAQ